MPGSLVFSVRDKLEVSFVACGSSALLTFCSVIKVRGTGVNKGGCSAGPDSYKQGELVGNAEGESRLGCSDHEMFKLGMLRGGNKDGRIVHSDMQEVNKSGGSVEK